MGRRRRRRRRLTTGTAACLVGGGTICALLFWGAFGPLPYNPTSANLEATLSPPSASHWFGTTDAGIDVFSSTIAAAGTTLPIAFAGVLIGLLLGTSAGLALSGQSRAQESCMRVVDLIQSFPVIVVAIVVVALAKSGSIYFWLTFAIAFISWPIFLRLVRASALGVRNERFVLAAEVGGASRWRVASRHVLPNISGVVLAQSSISVGFAVIAISALGYLGVGVPPPTPSWGALIREGASGLGNGEWWLVVFPSLAICVNILAFNLLARGVGQLLAGGEVAMSTPATARVQKQDGI